MISFGSLEEFEKVRQLFKEKRTNKDISNETNICCTVVNKWTMMLRKNPEAELPASKKRIYRWIFVCILIGDIIMWCSYCWKSDVLVDDCLELYRKGMRPLEISGATGVPRQRIDQWIKKYESKTVTEREIVPYSHSLRSSLPFIVERRKRTNNTIHNNSGMSRQSDPKKSRVVPVGDDPDDLKEYCHYPLVQEKGKVIQTLPHMNISLSLCKRNLRMFVKLLLCWPMLEYMLVRVLVCI